MRFQFPPDDPADAGPTYRSRLYERFADFLPVVTYGCFMWCITVFIFVQREIRNEGDVAATLSQLGMTTPEQLADGKWWGMIACAFVHAAFFHFLFNMLWLLRLSSLMERGLGSIKLVVFLIAASFVSSTYQLAIGGYGIGYSGVVFAMGGFMWGAWPRFTGFLEGFNGQTLKWFLIWQVICFFLSWTGSIPIGNTAHISGMLFGFLLGMWAQKGTKRGWYWLAASVIMLAGAVGYVAYFISL